VVANNDRIFCSDLCNSVSNVVALAVTSRENTVQLYCTRSTPRRCGEITNFSFFASSVSSEVTKLIKSQMQIQQTQRKCKRKASEMPVRSAASRDRLSQMIRSETSYRSVDDHILSNITNSPVHNQVWREQVSQWCYDVVDHLDASRELVYTTMNILDRYVANTSSSSLMNKVEYERTAITSFFLALKISSSLEIKISELLSLSRSTLQSRDILLTGKRILETLSWDSEILTPQSFVKVFISLLPSTLDGRAVMSWFELSMYLVEISVCDGNFAHVPPSQIAFAAILVAMKKAMGHSADRVTFDSFVRDMREETCIEFCSAGIQSLCVRLQNIYSQSQECSQTPHVVEDEDNDLNQLSNQPQLTPHHLSTQVNGASRPISPFPKDGS
jgi:hypothetical protein